jgi:23S rRNA (adenine2030-N6)-methyltransferase
MVDTFRILVSDTGPPDLIDVRFQVAQVGEKSGLVACGMLVKNPPFLLEPELRVLLPELVRVLGRDGAAGYSIERLTQE